LWQRRTTVVPAVLLHDATSFCLANWDPTAFRRAVNDVGDAGLVYNSQDVVAAMVYLSAVTPLAPGGR
jgi:hypothetical protein